MFMTTCHRLSLLALPLLAVSAAHADYFNDFDAHGEGFLGESFADGGITYSEANTVSGQFPDGETFGPADLGNQFIVERASAFYDDFPGYGSGNNSLTFGSAYIPGDNFSIGALASIWITPDTNGSAASLDLGYYADGPWGGIEWRLDAVRDGNVVASDSITISDGGGHDNPAWTTLSVDGAEFDSLHLYAWHDGAYSGPRGMIDDVFIATVPAPSVLALLGLAAVRPRRRRG